MTLDHVIDGLAVIGGLTCLYWVARGLIAFLGWVERSEIERQRVEEKAAKAKTHAPPRPAARPAAVAPAGGDIPPEHVAAIAAVVATLGQRVVLIQDIAGGQAWASEGRWIHQTSHRPH